MRTVDRQLSINKNILIASIKKLKTSLASLEEDIKKDKYAYLVYSHVQDDALAIALSIDKILLLQLMKDTDDPD